MTHQHTWNGVASASTFFAVTGAAIGNRFQENAGAVLSVLALIVMTIIQLRQKLAEGRVKALKIELEEAQLIAEIERTKQAAKTAVDQAASQAAEIINAAANPADANQAS